MATCKSVTYRCNCDISLLCFRPFKWFSDSLRIGLFGNLLPVEARPVLGLNQPPAQWTRSDSYGKSGQGVTLTIHPHLAPRLKKE